VEAGGFLARSRSAWDTQRKPVSKNKVIIITAIISFLEGLSIECHVQSDESQKDIKQKNKKTLTLLSLGLRTYLQAQHHSYYSASLSNGHCGCYVREH
jgi:hypothetical protein